VTSKQRIIGKLQKQFKTLDSETYADPDFARDRGRRFEKLVQDVFAAWGMLKRRAYGTRDNKSEQIDGALRFDNRYALLEVKWEQARLAASALFSFLGKVDGKFSGTIGVFVSRTELTENFLKALRAGRRQCIIVIHGQDVDDLFDPTFDLADYLREHVLSVCTDNRYNLTTEQYLRKLKMSGLKKKVTAVTRDVVEMKIKKCLTDKTAKNIVNEYAEELTQSQKVDAVLRILGDYADITASPSGDESWRGENLQEFLKELLKQLPSARTKAEATFFLLRLSPDFQSRYYQPMTEYFASRYVFLPAEMREKCEARLIRQWDGCIGDWMSENRMAEVTRLLWDYLGSDTKERLVGYFVEFILSDRRPYFPQHRLADYVLGKGDNATAAKRFLSQRIKEAAKFWIQRRGTDKTHLAETEKEVTSAMRSMRQYIPDFTNLVKAAVRKAADECKAKGQRS
jgi:hypothetical protein